MDFLKKMFHINKPDPNIMDKLKGTLANLQEKEKALLKKVAEEEEKASRLKNGMGATQCLQKKRLYELQLEQLIKLQLSIHEQINMIEAEAATAKTANALRAGAATLKAMKSRNKTFVADQVEKFANFNEQCKNVVDQVEKFENSNEQCKKVGLLMPTIEVRFEHLHIDAEAYVGSRALPTLFNFSANLLEGLLNYLHILPSRKRPFSILHDVSGIVKPRRLTLLLGPPSSGKTTLLLDLAGKLSKELKDMLKKLFHVNKPDPNIIDKLKVTLANLEEKEKVLVKKVAEEEEKAGNLAA